MIRTVTRRVEQRGDQRDLRHTQSAAADPARVSRTISDSGKERNLLHRATLDIGPV